GLRHQKSRTKLRLLPQLRQDAAPRFVHGRLQFRTSALRSIIPRAQVQPDGILAASGMLYPPRRKCGRFVMNSKQKIALDLIARWADRFDCIRTVVIYGSVARGDEKPDSDLDIDLEFVPDLSAPGMAGSYGEAQQSFDNLRKAISCATGHTLRISNYVIG